MINIKWGLVSAGAAFTMAFALSLLIGRTGLLIASLRAVVFTVLFFGMGIGIRALINTFIPELISSDMEEDTTGGVFFRGAAGSQVNITVDDIPNPALPKTKPEDDSTPDADEVGNFGDLLVSGISRNLPDIDQSPQTGYTEGTEEFTPVFENVKSSDTGNLSMDFSAFVPGGVGDDGMDDMDLGMDSFSFLPGSGSSESSGESPAPGRSVSGNKPMKLEGDFNPKEIAAGLRTVLEKEKKKG